MATAGEERRLRLLRTHLYGRKDHYHDQYGNPLSNELAHEIHELFKSVTSEELTAIRIAGEENNESLNWAWRLLRKAGW